MKSAKRVLLTGASGFVGRHTIQELQARDYEVHAVGRHPFTNPSINLVQHTVDLTDDDLVRRTIRAVAPTHLMHLAWDVTPGAFWSSSTNLDWVATSLRLYRAFVEHGGRRAIFAGTFAEYDWTNELLDEDATPLRPATLYGTAKCALHNLIAQSAESEGISTAWGRLFMLYGPHERAARLVPYVACALLQGRQALCGDGIAARDFMHVADAARALATILDGDHRGAINVASGACTPVRDVVATIADLIGRHDLVSFGARPTPPGEPPRLAASTRHLHHQQGFAPRFNLTDGLADTVRWWRLQLSRSASARR
jgi:nucleoside-diphosphate-sugar epimerase